MTFRGHMRSKIFSPYESPYITSYITSIDTFSLSPAVFEILNFKVLRVLTLTFGLRRSSEVQNISIIRKPIHDFLANFFWHSFSISYGFRDIRIQTFFRVWPWPLTFRGHWRTKICLPFETPCMTLYLTSVDTLSILYRFRDIRLQSF